MQVGDQQITLPKLLTNYNRSFWTEFYPAIRNIPMPSYYNLMVHPISLFIEFGLVNTYKYNERGEDKLLILMKSNCMFLRNFGVNFNKYIPKYFELYQHYLGYSAFLIPFAPIKDYSIIINKQKTYSPNVSELSKFFLIHDLFFQVNHNTKYACELIKKDLGNVECHGILPFENLDKETFREELLLINP